MDETKQFALKTIHEPEYQERYGDGPSWEEWSTLTEAEIRAKALRKQGAKVIIYQEV